MSRFNKGSRNDLTPTKNMEGADAYALPEEVELAGIILTSFIEPAFYCSVNKGLSRLSKLVTNYPQVAVSASLVARRKHGLRSISHITATLLAPYLSRSGIGQQYYRAIASRPDDILEILAIMEGKPTNAMKKGFARRLEEFDAYQLAKYARFERKQKVNLNDAVRLCHPKPTKALTLLKDRNLKNTDTWEARGNSAAAWHALLDEKRLGYLALLRNLRNIIQHGDSELTEKAANALSDTAHIIRAKVFPYQIYRAYTALAGASLTRDKHLRLIGEALGAALREAAMNFPELPGNTVVFLDRSASMEWNKRVEETALSMAAAISYRYVAPVIAYSSNARMFNTSLINNPIAAIESLKHTVPVAGTNLTAAFEVLAKSGYATDNIFILTDEEHWLQETFQATPGRSLGSYRKQAAGPITVYTIAPVCYGTTQFNAPRTFTLFGHSDKVMEVIPYLSMRPKDLITFLMREGNSYLGLA